MDKLKVAPEEIVAIPFRPGTEVRVTHHMFEAIGKLREALKETARLRGTMTYGEAVQVTDNAYAPNGMGRMLDVLSVDCIRRDEPSLAALVVRKVEGEVGSAFVGDADAERQDCYARWA